MEVNCRIASRGDVPAINRLYQQAYGSHYPYCVQADGLGDLNARYYVAETDEGNIQGVARTNRLPGNQRRSYELGGLAVNSDQQGNGVGKSLTLARLNDPFVSDAEGFFSEPVCYDRRCASQRNLVMNYGFQLSGIQLARYPAIAPGIMGTQPETLALAVKPAQGRTEHRRYRIVATPAIGEGISLLPGDWRRQLRLTDCAPGPMPIGEIHIQTGYAVERYPSGCDVVDLPANWEQTAAYLQHYTANGYILAGILPTGAHDEIRYDYIRLVRIQSRINYRLIHVVDELIPFLRWQLSQLD